MKTHGKGMGGLRLQQVMMCATWQSSKAASHSILHLLGDWSPSEVNILDLATQATVQGTWMNCWHASAWIV